MAESIKVTREGYNRLLEQKKSLYDQLKEVQGKKGEAAEVGGNVWHDNFSFEQLCREEMMLNKRIADLAKQINGSEIIAGIPDSEEFLQIGHVAVLLFDDEEEERRYEVTGLGESDLKADPPKIEYLAPIIKGFMGKEVDTTFSLEIGGKVREITLIEILRKEI